MKTLCLIALIGLVGSATVSAGSSSAPMTVGVTVVRSCSVDLRPTADAPSAMPRVTCASGAQSALRISESVRKVSQTDATATDGKRVVTLNF